MCEATRRSLFATPRRSASRRAATPKAWLSIEARKILDAAGFQDAAIVASNDLDEHLIASLKEQGAQIRVWGVGTQLVTGGDQAALGGVYKLSAIRERPDAPWRHCIKLSEQAVKVSIPGILQVRRFELGGEALGDLIFDESAPTGDGHTLIDPFDATRRKVIPAEATCAELLQPVLRHGASVGPRPSLADGRRRCREQLSLFSPSVRRFVHPHAYPVGLEGGLHERRQDLILKARGHQP
jgi:nicotinate phosphoribosyltransferase